jgi:hypothetical protein
MSKDLKDNRLRWKHGYASYNYHTPLEYEIIEKGKRGDPKHPYSKIKIRPLSLGPIKYTHTTLRRKDAGNYVSISVNLSSHEFWIPRRMIRRGPNSWSIKKNRWVHEATLLHCLNRAQQGYEEYRPPMKWNGSSTIR